MTAALNCLARSRRLALRAASVAIVVFALAGAAGAQCTGYGTQIGAQFQQVTGALTNYTAVISVTDSRLATVANGGLSQSTGFDICIGDSANTVAFPLQIRKYVATTGAYMAAVQVPSLSASAVTVVNLWVGKAGVSDPSTTAAWDANFMQVYPLQETCTPDSATAGCFKDATSRAAHSTGGKYPTQVAGLLGNAQSFVSASNENIVVPNQVTTGNAITLSGWFKTSTTTASTLIYDQRAGVSHNLGCYVYTNVSGFIGALCGNGSNDVTLTGSANLANGLWHHYAFANIGATLTGYVDGASIGSAINGAGAIVFGTGSSCIGHYCSGGTIPWNGSLQDLRLSNTSRSAAWIKADYDAFHAPGTFFQLTAPVSGPTITSVGWSNLSAYSAVFTWSTGAAKADSQVECGINGGSSGGPYTTYTTPISDPVQIGSSDLWGVTAHRLGVNLPASYGGHCIVLSTNQAGGTTASADQTVTTPAAPVNIPIGVASVSPRVNLTNGATGYSGDIDMMAATADGQWILAGNDGAGKAISSSQYCCTDTLSNGARLHMSKWPTLTTRYMLLRQDDSTPTSPIHNVFGPQPLTRLATEPYWEITGGSCAAGVAIVNFEDRGYTIPVGTPIWVAGASPAGYNVSSVAIAASTATSVQYTGTCAALAWVSGGTVAIWNDGMGTHQSNFGIDSVNGLVCFTAVRTVPPYNSFRICSTDYFAHSFNHAHNAPGGPATVANVDMPLPSTPCFLPGCAGYRPLLQIVPCRDYGGANQTAFPCTWLAGTENYIYYVGTSPQVPSGYYLFREAYADHKLVDGARWQAYIGAQVCDDRMLYNANWSSTLTAGTLLNSQVAAYGQSFSIVTAPDFNGFIGAQWTGLPGNIPAGNVSQSAGATLYDMGPWLTCTATPLGSVNRDETDINYFPTWSFLVPASYNTVSSGVPVRATVQLRQSGSVVSSTGNPSNNKYGPNLYTINLAQRWTGPKGNGGPTFSYAGGRRVSFISNGLDLLYTFEDASGTQVVTNSSPNDALGAYSTALTQTKIALYDRYGLFSFGFPVDATYGSPGANGYPFFVTTPYAVQNADFTLAVVFEHVDTGNTGPPVGECVIYRASLRICRNGTMANSWLVTVGATTSVPLAVTCDGRANFCGLIVNRLGSTAKIYSTAGVQSNIFPLTALATITDGTALANDALVVGAKADGTLQFQGWISVLAVYNRSLRDTELQHFAAALRRFEAVRGITLP